MFKRAFQWVVTIAAVGLFGLVATAQTPEQTNANDSAAAGSASSKRNLTLKERYQLWLQNPQTQPSDTTYLGRKRISGVRPSDKWDLYIGRSFLIYYRLNGSIPFNSAFSGAWSVGFTWNLFVRRNWSIRFGPWINYFNITTQRNNTQMFPALDSGAYEYQSVRALYFDLPVSVNRIVSRDRKRKRIETLFDVGVSVGIAAYSERYQRRESDRARIVVANDGVLNLFRSQVFVRLRYKFIGISASYRYTPIYKRAATFVNDKSEKVSYPRFGGVEIGLFIAL